MIQFLLRKDRLWLKS